MLAVSHLVKRFGGLVAVNDASLAVRDGEIVALIGPNGAGKTTLFATIAGFFAPDAGRVEFLGEDVTGRAPHLICARGLARTFQVTQPFAGLTVAENIAVGAHVRHRSRRDALAHAREVAFRVGLGPLIDRPASALTVAARKRLELARALATGPKLLLLDEVMAGLNPTEVHDIVAIVRAIRDGGAAILLVEHVMQAVMALSERVYVLSAGRIIADGAPQALVRDPTVIEAYLGHGAAKRLQGAAA
jgi:branched-chain amino acid transport system ATP-binding protein